MIKINLLPVRAARRKETARNELILGGVVLALALVLFVIWNQALGGQIATKEREIRATEQKLKDLEKVLKEIEVFKKRKRDLEKKVGVIDRLEKNRLGPVRVLDDLSTAIPDRVFIKSFKTKGRTITMTGFALNNDVLVDFEENIRARKTKHITNPQILFTRDEGIRLLAWRENP